MGPEENILVNSSISTIQQGLTHSAMGFRNLLRIFLMQFLSGTLRMRLALPMCQPNLLGNPCCTFLEDSCLPLAYACLSDVLPTKILAVAKA